MDIKIDTFFKRFIIICRWMTAMVGILLMAVALILVSKNF